MKLYHYTTRDGAASIIENGFRDSDPVPSLGIHAGVWFVDVPTVHATTQLAGRASGEFVVVEVPEAVAARFLISGSPGETVGRRHEFCVPALVAKRVLRRIVDKPLTTAHSAPSKTTD